MRPGAGWRGLQLQPCTMRIFNYQFVPAAIRHAAATRHASAMHLVQAQALVTRDTVEAEVRQYMSQLKGMCACPPCPQTPSSCHEQTARPPVAQSDRLKVAAMRVCPCALERSIEARHAEGPTRREAPRRRRSL